MTMRARQFKSQDFEDFDLIVAMDHSNLRDIRRWQGNHAKVRLAMSFVQNAAEEIVPDPYYGHLRDFENVADLLESACDGILAEILSRDPV
jgi:protein-tyrosine phosphatase